MAIKKNFELFKKLSRPAKLMGVIKSNAYGHDLIGFAKKLEELQVDFLGVDSITEAIALRREGVKKPILVLGYTVPENFKIAAEKDIQLTISSVESVKYLQKSGFKKIRVHLKIDTGMHRQGFLIEDLPVVLSLMPKSALIGLYTHFASAKRPERNFQTEKQIVAFTKAKSYVLNAGFKNVICHAAATAGILNYPSFKYDMVRVGIGLYGLWPSLETKKTHASKINLTPVLTWKTLVCELKWVEKGEGVGYDYTETLKQKTLLAVLPVGYWHGYFRAFSSKAFVLIGKKRCKVIGRISMDMAVVDVTGVKGVKVGDEVVLIGKQGKQEVTAEELAEIAGTTNYEVVTRLNPLIKREFK